MYERRREKLSVLLKKAGLDAVLISGAAGIYYYSGFRGEESFLLVDAEESVIITDGRFTEQALQESPQSPCLVHDAAIPWPLLIAGQCQKRGWKRLGFEENNLTVACYEQVKDAAPDLELVPAGEIMAKTRQQKDALELEAIREAVNISDKALVQLCEIIGEGQSERYLARRLEEFLVEGGAESLAFPTIMASGPNAALPHAKPTDRLLQKGDFLLIDFGARFAGYCSDMTRTFFIGNPDERAQTVHDLVWEALETATCAVKNNIICANLYQAAREVFQREGVAENFVHSLGHGVGIEIHEGPFLRAANQTPLQTGEIITIEPGLYFPGWGGVRIEDCVLVTAREPEVLTHFRRDLFAF